jgi:pyridinium-3,5-bisthiocarboxylic acid mononucleotide nickel chelatase
MPTIAHLDCFSGASGDMLLGALLDAGLRLPELKRDLARLRLPPVRLSVRSVRRGSLTARLVTVTPRRPFPRQPTFAGITTLVRRSRLPPHVIERSLASLQALRDVEAVIHGDGHGEYGKHRHGGGGRRLPDAFRGLSLIDTLVDVVGVVTGIERLGIAGLTVSPINLGRGMINHADGALHHGPLPVPGPATARLLTGYAVYSDGPAAELTTPTAAALIRTLARPSSSLPLMRLTSVGHGAGHHRLDPWPNLVRLMVGEGLSERMSTAPPSSITEESVVEIETTVDDCNPQLFDHLRERLFARGALDVYLTPVIMKQGRPATQITLLAQPRHAADLIPLLFEETPTLGVRLREIRRWVLPRRLDRMQTPDGPVRVKLVRTPYGLEARPEYRDGRTIAKRTGEPLRAVLRRLERLAEQRFAPRRR